MDVPSLPPAVEAEQLRLLGEARDLVERSRSDFAQMQPSEVVSIETRAHPQSRCVVGVDIGFVETYTAAVCFRLEDVDLGRLGEKLAPGRELVVVSKHLCGVRGEGRERARRSARTRVRTLHGARTTRLR